MAKPEIVYHYRGVIERGPRYDLRDGYSANSATGGTLFPWSTKRECQHEAKLMGARAVFMRDGKKEG